MPMQETIYAVENVQFGTMTVDKLGTTAERLNAGGGFRLAACWPLAGMKVGRALAAHGAMERFAMDFVTVKREDGA